MCLLSSHTCFISKIAFQIFCLIMALFKSHTVHFVIFARMFAMYIDVEMPLEFTPQSFESILCVQKWCQGHVLKRYLYKMQYVCFIANEMLNLTFWLKKSLFSSHLVFCFVMYSLIIHG